MTGPEEWVQAWIRKAEDDFYDPSEEEAQQAVEYAGRIRSFVRIKLDLES